MSVVAPLSQQVRYILTGGPGVGKTSILNALANLNYSVISEAATDIISQEQTLGIERPQLQPGFDDKVIELQRRRQQEAVSSKASVVFFDRSPVDVEAYAKGFSGQASSTIAEEVTSIVDQRYYDTMVFLIEKLPFVTKDGIRYEDLEQSMQIEAWIKEQYLKYSYKLIPIPAKADLEDSTLLTPEERAKIIIKLITG
jgi:predicted ATPase